MAERDPAGADDRDEDGAGAGDRNEGGGPGREGGLRSQSGAVSAVTVATGGCFGAAVAVASWNGPAPLATVALFGAALLVVGLNAVVGGSPGASATATLAVGAGVTLRSLAAPVVDGTVGPGVVLAVVVLAGAAVPGAVVHGAVGRRFNSP